MKKLIYLLASITLLFSCSGTKKTTTAKESDAKYRIKRIVKNHSWYMIYAKRNDTLYKIVSYAKNNIDKNCRKIVVGGKYDLELISENENAPVIGGIKLAPVSYTGCYVFDKETTICLEPRRGIYELFYTHDLKGICYLK